MGYTDGPLSPWAYRSHSRVSLLQVRRHEIRRNVLHGQGEAGVVDCRTCPRSFLNDGIRQAPDAEVEQLRSALEPTPRGIQWLRAVLAVLEDSRARTLNCHDKFALGSVVRRSSGRFGSPSQEPGLDHAMPGLGLGGSCPPRGDLRTTGAAPVYSPGLDAVSFGLTAGMAQSTLVRRTGLPLVGRAARTSGPQVLYARPQKCDSADWKPSRHSRENGNAGTPR